MLRCSYWLVGNPKNFKDFLHFFVKLENFFLQTGNILFRLLENDLKLCIFLHEIKRFEAIVHRYGINRRTFWFIRLAVVKSRLVPEWFFESLVGDWVNVHIFSLIINKIYLSMVTLNLVWIYNEPQIRGKFAFAQECSAGRNSTISRRSFLKSHAGVELSQRIT